ncbi:catechol 2,3-dioxygenase-like lactoylglutathione lyase family enzyme [Flavobacterium arsenatis]|uniref:Catechol 2,3-dioxygenase-like lactoylglutathione lyase family enzyme n=1 Tax=Flavobacterium arsenatis TaxID=1484332 RepID=A0ABU1TQ87_9FLAO|nr:VOC family protein [Flavobacterium arsenatis]MDR6968058.1 catechol 2,3-dioxygenase-like lactoylglutathione lyase family enzyme [Flavobacterium arsenatis]
MTFRFARHTNNLEQLKSFYIDVLGLELLGGFENHSGYDGIFIGKSNENWHLEFTRSDEVVAFHFSDEDILVFYPNTKLEFDAILDKIITNKIQFLKAKNPYWNENGKMFLDPDGYRVVISNLKIK